MATGIEMVFGLEFGVLGEKEIQKRLEQEGLKDDIKKTGSEESEDVNSIYKSLIALKRKELEECYIKCLKDIGWEIIKKKKEDDWSTYFVVKTDKGIREMSMWTLETFVCDEYEQEYPKDAKLGIAISSRYFPTFIDYADTGGTLSNVRLTDPKIQKMIKMAEEGFRKIFPVLFKDAIMFPVERHY